MEHSFIAWAKHRASKLPQVALGIGDDCALLSTNGDDFAITTDSLCEGTHFILADCGGYRVGRKLLAVNLSDLASMAAEPIAVFLSLCLPRSGAGDLAASVFDGVFDLAKQYGVAIAGGDTNVWDGPLVVHLTAVGRKPSGTAWKRSGAKPGDAIVVSGELGGSILGKHLEFEPRIELARELFALGIVTAATDISDGLGVDLLNITVASRCGAEVELGRVPISPQAVELSERTGRTPLEHALGDGEDFELLLSVPQENLPRLPSTLCGIRLSTIGNFVGRTGLWSRSKSGVEQLAARGYVHGQSREPG